MIKTGANAFAPNPTVAEMIGRIFTHLPLFTGYAFYGISTVMLVIALRHGELSLLYPVIALMAVGSVALSMLLRLVELDPQLP